MRAKVGLQLKAWEEVFGWLPDENAELLDSLIAKHQIETVIEIGAFVGKSAVFFASRVKEVWSVEPFLEREMYVAKNARRFAKGQRAAFMEHTEGYPNIHLLEMTSEQAAQKPIRADLIYLDGSHEYEDVRDDIARWYPKAKKVLCGDDYSAWWPGVRKAVDESSLPINAEQRLWFLEI